MTSETLELLKNPTLPESSKLRSPLFSNSVKTKNETYKEAKPYSLILHVPIFEPGMAKHAGNLTRMAINYGDWYEQYKTDKWVSIEKRVFSLNESDKNSSDVSKVRDYKQKSIIVQGGDWGAKSVSKTGKVLVTLDIDNVSELNLAGISSFEELEAEYKKLDTKHFMFHISGSGKPKISFILKVRDNWSEEWNEKRMKLCIKNVFKKNEKLSSVYKAIDPAGFFPCFLTKSLFNVLKERFHKVTPIEYNISTEALGYTLEYPKALEGVYDDLKKRFKLSKKQTDILLCYLAIRSNNCSRYSNWSYYRKVGQTTLKMSVSAHKGLDNGYSRSTIGQAFKKFKELGLIVVRVPYVFKKESAIYEIIDPYLRLILDNKEEYFEADKDLLGRKPQWPTSLAKKTDKLLMRVAVHLKVEYTLEGKAEALEFCKVKWPTEMDSERVKKLNSKIKWLNKQKEQIVVGAK